MRTEYMTDESRQSAIDSIDGCIKALTELPGLPYQIGDLTMDYTIKFLSEYKKLIRKDMGK